MIGHLAYAEGSPCPTLVLDSRYLPDDDTRLREVLTGIRHELMSWGGDHILKIALIRPSDHPMFDLDYRFVQALPGAADRFELRGSCGHSVLAAVATASRAGLLAPLSPGTRVRVHVLNNGDSVVCEADRVERDGAWFTVRFVHVSPTPLRRLLMTGQALTVVETPTRRHTVSLVNGANPYVFVDARALGVRDADALFAGGDDLAVGLETIRGAATDVLGWPRVGTFPKIAALIPDEGKLAVRALSVPSWHPTIALTGAVCLAAAVAIPGTIPRGLAREAEADGASVGIRTPGGETRTASVVTEGPEGDALLWTSVIGKQVTLLGSCALEHFGHMFSKEAARWLELSVSA
ncbi:PrpF domain-containing protein [Streptomyces sp. ST2-7A]|uniref:PrpF domain-containing protein n=1 Tax=Streptomyces sp. ST2-7A TaxID=2907214 RepID=UPI001F2AD54C|nr:PrpF domain-containing protein [Streptomyces sp. ST2-7A]MCE7079522.1 hypothetical protein [Streptomyces sp. ST2-7A]